MEFCNLVYVFNYPLHTVQNSYVPDMRVLKLTFKLTNKVQTSTPATVCRANHNPNQYFLWDIGKLEKQIKQIIIGY